MKQSIISIAPVVATENKNEVRHYNVARGILTTADKKATTGTTELVACEQLSREDLDALIASDKKAKVIGVSHPSHTFFKHIRLPPVDPSKVMQIMKYEAQQHVPFPLGEVMWEGHVIGTSASGDIPVHLSAMKSDLVPKHFPRLDALYSPDLALKSLYEHVPKNEAQMHVLHADEFTTMMIALGKGTFFSRSMNISPLQAIRNIDPSKTEDVLKERRSNAVRTLIQMTQTHNFSRGQMEINPTGMAVTNDVLYNALFQLSDKPAALASIESAMKDGIQTVSAYTSFSNVEKHLLTSADFAYAAGGLRLVGNKAADMLHNPSQVGIDFKQPFYVYQVAKAEDSYLVLQRPEKKNIGEVVKTRSILELMSALGEYLQRPEQLSQLIIRNEKPTRFAAERKGVPLSFEQMHNLYAVLYTSGLGREE